MKKTHFYFLCLRRKKQRGTMAELSTLSPSSPALGDHHAAPAITPSSSVLPAPETVQGTPIPKSSLYNDKALTGSTPAGRSPSTPHLPTTLAQLTEETPIPSLVNESVPQREESARKEMEAGCEVSKQETMSGGPAVVELLNPGAETSQLNRELQATHSSDLNPGPNLYPNVHVTNNPSPVADDGEPQKEADSSPTPAPPPGTSADDEENPSSLQQAQKPQSDPPLSPKPDSLSEARREDPPTTPTRAGHASPTVPLIHEPTIPLPNPNRRHAPDNLSYLESASLMSGTLESLSGLGEDGSSVGSDSEINGLTIRRTDKYGFLGGNQYSEGG